MRLRALAVAMLLGSGACRASTPDSAHGSPDAQPRDSSELALSDALKAPRPRGGEYFGLYLMGKKVGYIYSDLRLMQGVPSRAQAVTEFVFQATLGSKVAQRRQKETRTYEAKPGGRLLAFTIEQRGDGGDQRLDGTCTPKGMTVTRKRPDQADQTLQLPPSKERIEDADQARVALMRHAPVEGHTTDGQDLESYAVTTTLGGVETRALAGVSVRLERVTTLSQKEKVPVDLFIDAKGRLVELRFGDTMKALAESETIAKRLDQVEVFGLTRVVLPAPLPEEARRVPGNLALELSGLPEKFQQDTYRQKFKPLPGGRVQVTIDARAPTARGVVRPLADPNGGRNLKSTLSVEVDNPEIRQAAATILDGEKQAYAAAKKIVAWVSAHMTKEYGASADRSTDVLKKMRGDCTEHALLSVALLRAAGIPAKRVDGLLYMRYDDEVPALYWHEWVEAFVGEWTQLDPTAGQDVADATHLALGEEANAEIAPLIGQLKVTAVK